MGLILFFICQCDKPSKKSTVRLSSIAASLSALCVLLNRPRLKAEDINCDYGVRVRVGGELRIEN